jgi:hypothetical protein
VTCKHDKDRDGKERKKEKKKQRERERERRKEEGKRIEREKEKEIERERGGNASSVASSFFPFFLPRRSCCCYVTHNRNSFVSAVAGEFLSRNSRLRSFKFKMRRAIISICVLLPLALASGEWKSVTELVS